MKPPPGFRNQPLRVIQTEELVAAGVTINGGHGTGSLAYHNDEYVHALHAEWVARGRRFGEDLSDIDYTRFGI